MWQYIIKKIAYGFIIIVTVVCTISSIIYLSPVDPARLSFGQLSDAKTVESKRKSMGLDQPLSKQLLYYLRDLSPVNILGADNIAIANYSSFKLLGIGNKVLLVKWPYMRDSYQSGTVRAFYINNRIFFAKLCYRYIFCNSFCFFVGTNYRAQPNWITF